ncbi:cdc42 effector protein 3 [Electrophorus electricus]|uniref:cdc42 effector protein 3 n=1 Tax=Electrophorus electricus TaxID=8005 RepID=UPI000F09CFFB|nr:cdc42 effector protein 3 [Electrophorus electricus]XP_026869973.1 cdc42 effector protein 3 [Electrophorus electricus]
MPAKTPIYLKSNNHKKGKKCRLRDILSPDMISPPLGDFRHTIHIGKGGECDTFGDMSFLQGKFELLPGKGGMIRPQYGTHGEFTRANSASDASFIETPSPILKNAISLPTIGGSQAITLPLISTTIFPMTQDPLDGLAGLPTPASSEERDDLEILKMETLLQSITVFRRDPSPVPEEVVEKPTFTINLTEKPSAKKTTCHNNKHNTENKKPEKLLKAILYNGNSNENGNSNGNSSWSNDYSHSNGDTFFPYERELAGLNGDWAGRDSGMEEGRICDFDFELSKGKSASQESVSQVNGSLLSLELDLGPSILDDVLNIMSRPES